MQALNITNLSKLLRYGVKGANAAKWLANHGVAIPTKANTWVFSGNAIIMRLGSTEFLIEDAIDGKVYAKLETDVERVIGVYKVPRVDASFLLAGSGVLNLLSEVCALDLRESALAENDVLMTQVASISATVLRQSVNNETVYRIWCDGTYNQYMQHILSDIAQELTGSTAKI